MPHILLIAHTPKYFSIFPNTHRTKQEIMYTFLISIYSPKISTKKNRIKCVCANKYFTPQKSQIEIIENFLFHPAISFQTTI